MCLVNSCVSCHVGGIKTSAGYEKEETRDAEDADRVSESKTY